MALFLITAPSGSGKSTLVKELEKRRQWREAKSHTTREMRDGEKQGVDYHFVSKAEFAHLVGNEEFLEVAEYDGNFYGVSKKEVEKALKENTHAVVIVEHNGYLQIKSKYPDAIGIFLHMDEEDCIANMFLRGDSINKAMNRISTYRAEMQHRILFDYVVKNVRGKLIETVAVIISILNQNSEG